MGRLSLNIGIRVLFKLPFCIYAEYILNLLLQRSVTSCHHNYLFIDFIYNVDDVDGFLDVPKWYITNSKRCKHLHVQRKIPPPIYYICP